MSQLNINFQSRNFANSNAAAIIKTAVMYDFSELKNHFPCESIIRDGIESILNSLDFYELIANSSNEFTLEGRGKEWAENAGDDRGILVRREGVEELLKLLNSDRTLNFNSDFKIGDCLAGNGYVNRVANLLLESDRRPSFINSDLSFYMYKDCFKQNLFALWQSAEKLIWLKNQSLDAVLFAYGSHHINNRSQAVNEAVRVLKPGGRFVLHDFEENSPMANWFGDVVSHYSKTPHDYPHFTKQEMLSLTKNANLNDINIEYIDDPFIIVAETEQKVLTQLAQYVINLYGLTKLNGDIATTLKLLSRYFGIHTRQLERHKWEAKIIRKALICSATK